MKFLSLIPFIPTALGFAAFHPHDSGHLHLGNPTGHITKIANISTYVTGSTKSKNTILYLTDIFGYKFPNNQLLADEFAAAGNLVIMPDYLQGDPVPFPIAEDFDLDAYFIRHSDAVIDPIITAVREALGSKKYRTETLTATGHCFGAHHAVRLLAQPGVLDAAYIAHPSLVGAEDLSKITAPLSIAAAEIDTAFTQQIRWNSEPVLAATGQHWEIRLYGNTTHGFAVRGEPGDAWAEYARVQAREQALDWFKFFTK